MMAPKEIYPFKRSRELVSNEYALLAAHKDDRPRRLAIRPESATRWSPQISLFEDLDVFVIEALISDMDPSRISVTVEGNFIVFSGDKSRSAGMRGTESVPVRTNGQRFVRKIKLPETVDLSKMRIDYKNNALMITKKKKRMRVA